MISHLSIANSYPTGAGQGWMMGGFVISPCQVSAKGFMSAPVTIIYQMTSCGHLMACDMHKVAVVTHSRSSAWALETQGKAWVSQA